MDEEEGESFDYQPDENLEEEEEYDEEDLENEAAQIKAYDSETEEEVHKTDALVKLQMDLVELNKQIERQEISFQRYNEMLIYIQRMIVEETLKKSEILEHADISKGLMREIGSMFLQLKEEQYIDRFDPKLVEMNIDDIFRKYGEILENQLAEEDAFIFESNPITSNISTVVNLPVPEKYQKQLQVFEQQIEKNNISVEDIYSYLNLRLSILTDNLRNNLRYDVFYVNFQMDLQLEFSNLRSELELLVGATPIVIDEDMTEFNKKHGIAPGMLKSRKDILTNVNILKQILDLKIDNLVKKYTTVQEKVFKKQDSKEILRIINQLREIYIKNKFHKLERKFTDEEIVDDLKNKPLDFIVDKYAEYIESEYFDWASKKTENDFIYERPKYQKKIKITEKERLLQKDSEMREYTQRREFEKILSTLPKEILLKCADRLIAEGKLHEPESELSPWETFVNRLYADSTRIMTLSSYHPQSVLDYAKEINKMADEFMIDRHTIEMFWNLENKSKLDVGDVVYVDRTNERIAKTLKEMQKVQMQIELITKIKSEGTDSKVNDLQHKLSLLQGQLKSYNKYMRAPQLKGIAIKINKDTVDVQLEGSKNVQNFPITIVSRYLKPGKTIPLYNVVDSDAFNPAAPLKINNFLAISRWIKVVLKNPTLDANNKELMIELYEEALKVYNELSEDKRTEIDNKIMATMPEQYKSQFVNGIPSKGPLIFKYPPQLPEIPEKDEPNLEEFIDYSNKLQEYVQNLTPETNPYVKVGVPVTNQLIYKVDEMAYPNLETAIQKTPINGFFKLKNINGFKTLVLDLMSTEDKRSLQMLLLSHEEIKEYMEMFYLGQQEAEQAREEQAKSKTKSKTYFSNANLSLVNDLKSITNQNEYIQMVNKIDRDIKIAKIVGEEVFFEGKTQPMLKSDLEKSLMNYVTRQTGSTSSAMIKQDPITLSIEWALSMNPTFQLLDLSKRLPGSLIVHTEPKYRIRIISSRGHFYTGWTINPIEKIENKKLIYKYKFPIVITDFTEYLKTYRNSLFVRYENFKQIDILSYDEFNSSNYLLRHIQYITEYLKNIGQDDGFTIEMIKQQDAYLKIRQEQRNELLQALIFMYGSVVDDSELKRIANEIELEVYNSFKDIREGSTHRKTDHRILTSDQSEDFQLLLKFKKSGLPKTYVTRAIYSRGDKDLYEAYLFRMSVTVFNIYRTNNFVESYIQGKVNLESIIYRDLTREEIGEGPDTIESLVAWTPPTKVLSEMKTSYPDAYNTIIKNAPEIIDISVINQFEQETRAKMSFLNKKLALIELMKLKTWDKILANINNVEKSKRLMYLIHNRNSIRAVNNITAQSRLTAYNDLLVHISNCKIITNEALIEQYAENIEVACYSLSSNGEEYKKILGNIITSKTKLCKLISIFNTGNVGPVDIVANIAELYLDFGKTTKGYNSLEKAKLGDWDGVKELPNEILLGIKKVANSMSEAHTKLTKTGVEFKMDDEGKYYALDKIIKDEEYKVHKDSEGKFIIKRIEKPFVIDEKKRHMNLFLKMVKHNYVPRVNDVLSAEIQKVIDKNDLTESVIDDLNSREGINSKDMEKLKSLTYEQLLDINGNLYREPTFVDVIPMSMAREGVRVYPVKNRGGFLIGGNFPLDPRAYRYRDSEGKSRTKLVDICEMVGMNTKTFKTMEIVLMAGLGKLDSIYSKEIVMYENKLIECVKKLLDSRILIKIYKEDLLDSEQVLSKIITAFGMYKPIEESVVKYFNEFGGNKQLFVNGGTKEEFDSFFKNTLYTEAMKKILGVPTLVQKKEKIDNFIPFDDRIEVSILKNGDQEIYRKLYKSKTQTYPIPVRYNHNNYPVYSGAQKGMLAFLIDTGHISPWYKNKITITKTKNDIQFEGDLPFVIDETSSSTGYSEYYVEQIFKDPMYGLPIVTRIGISPKRIQGAEGANIIKKIKLPENKFIVKEEPLKIKYFKSQVPAQSQVNDFRLAQAQNPQPLQASELAKKSGYSIIDSRMLSYSIKYTPDDVWSWDPLVDYKVGAQQDNDKWIDEKNRQMAGLKEWLRKAGSSSSAFIAAKNEATRHLQWFRINLPSQKRMAFSHTKFQKPAKSTKEISVMKISKKWKKYSKQELINEAKRIDFYTPDMLKMKKVEIFSRMKTKLDDEIKINAQIIEKIGVDILDQSIIEEHMKLHAKSHEIANYSHYINKCIKHGFLVISPEVMKIIENPKTLFPNYNRYEVSFNESGHVQIFAKYDNSGPYNSEVITETIYEIIKNMSQTISYGFNKDVVKYINNISLYEKLGDQEKMQLVTEFPIMKLILKIKEKGQRITIWNILTTACDMWIPVIQHGMKKEIVDGIYKRTFKYLFDEPIAIIMEDVVNYLGDSYYQNSKYSKGIVFEQIANKYTGNVLYLQPGYKFEKIVSDEVSFTNDKSSSMKYVHNPYVRLFRNIHDKNPKTSIEMLIVGDDLYDNKIAVSSNLARRAALMYNVDPTIINPLFSVPDPNISGKFKEVAITKEDVFKYLEKGGNPFTILEMPDAELKFRKLPIGEKDRVIKTYRNAVREYFKSKDKKETYDDLIKKKRLNPLTLGIYINKVKSANVPPTQLTQFIDNLNILPDFLDYKWPTRKKILDKEFVESTGMNVNNFLDGEKREMYINVPRPTSLLYKKKVYTTKEGKEKVLYVTV
jgi:hypothetical protein